MEKAQHFKGGPEGESHPVRVPAGPARIRRRSGGKGETDGRIRELLRDYPRGATAEEVGGALSLGRSTARRHLEAMARAGELGVETYGQTRVFTLPRQAGLASVIRKPAPLVLVLSPDLRVTGVNDLLLSVFGLGRGDLVGRQIASSPLARLLGKQVLGQILKGREGTTGVQEFECLVGDARYIFRAGVTPVAGSRGPAGMVLSLEDVTGTVLHRRRIEELMDGGTLALLSSNPRILDDMLHRREEEEQLRLIRESVDHVPVAALWIGRDGRVLRVNRAAAGLLGYPEEELLGMTWAALDPDQPPDSWDALWGALDIRPGASFEGRFRTKEGIHVPVAIRAGRIRHGTREFGFVLAEDIARRKEEEEALRSSESSLREANRRLNLLAALTRHDALNDIAALGMYLELAKAGPAAGPEVPLKMAGLLHALRHKLEFSRDYAGLGMTAPGWEELSAAVGRGIAAKDTGLLRVDLDMPAVEIYRDPLFERAVANLVDNTLRHGEHASCLRFSALPDGEGCTLLVEDDGVGIPAERKEAVFRSGYGRKSGLGLFLVREILGITGMTIRETGEPGKGARFEIRIPGDSLRVKEGPAGALADAPAAGMLPGPGQGTGRAITQ